MANEEKTTDNIMRSKKIILNFFIERILSKLIFEKKEINGFFDGFASISHILCDLKDVKIKPVKVLFYENENRNFYSNTKTGIACCPCQ